jgi:transcriptional regulator with XRE-family HTH domain
MDTPSWTNKVFGEELRRVRKAAQMTQEELAFRAELDRTYISLLERGSKSPTLTTFFRLCRVLDQQPDVFIAQIYERMMSREQSQQQNNEE